MIIAAATKAKVRTLLVSATNTGEVMTYRKIASAVGITSTTAARAARVIIREMKDNNEAVPVTNFSDVRSTKDLPKRQQKA